MTRPYGPWARIGTVFTNAELACGLPLQRNFCGRCHRCVEACPAKALKENGWYAGIEREELLDAQLCDRCKKQHFHQYHKGQNCTICSAVCPFGIKIMNQNRDKQGEDNDS